MGRPSNEPTSRDMALARTADGAQFTAAGQASAPIEAKGVLNVTLAGAGWTGGVALERSFDGGTTWHQAFGHDHLIPRTYSAPVSHWHYEAEAGVLYRLRCTALSAGGPIPYRLSA